MTDQNTPLSDEERAELEALRAEKARREEEARARKERAELEALRAEQAAADAATTPQEPVAPGPKPRRAPRPQEPVVDPENLTFGQKMVMTADEEDEDGVPPMPPAQKLIIAVGVVLLVIAGFWIVKNNLG